MAKTYQEIQAEANRKFGNKASDEKFKWRQEQQKAAGLDVEKSTRGGIAGAYDRNKKLVGAAVTAAGYMMGGPAGAAASRGFLQGVDRPGKSGIGFDVGRAAKGAMEGYAAGNVANLGKMGFAKLTGGGVSSGGVPSGAAPTQRVFDPTRGGYVDVGGTSSPVSMSDRLTAGTGRIGEMVRGAGQYIAKKPEVAGQALTAYAGSRQAAANRELQREQLKQRESEFEREYGLRRGQDERELERQRRIAEMLAPLFQRIAGGQG
jgi:hypothetical protein